MLRQHENQLYEWVRTGREYYSVSSLAQSFSVLLYSAFSILIIVNYISRGGQPGEILLLFYWTLNLPALGQSLANQIQTYPMLRNRVLRLLEPLSAPDEEDLWSEQSAAPAGGGEPPRRRKPPSRNLRSVCRSSMCCFRQAGI